ncbi:hypothetical protein VTN96DRAFT_5789 [Rasamsonia emersonii]
MADRRSTQEPNPVDLNTELKDHIQKFHGYQAQHEYSRFDEDDNVGNSYRSVPDESYNGVPGSVEGNDNSLDSDAEGDDLDEMIDDQADDDDEIENENESDDYYHPCDSSESICNLFNAYFPQCVDYTTPEDLCNFFEECIDL